MRAHVADDGFIENDVFVDGRLLCRYEPAIDPFAEHGNRLGFHVDYLREASVFIAVGAEKRLSARDSLFNRFHRYPLVPFLASLSNRGRCPREDEPDPPTFRVTDHAPN